MLNCFNIFHVFIILKVSPLNLVQPTSKLTNKAIFYIEIKNLRLFIRYLKRKSTLRQSVNRVVVKHNYENDKSSLKCSVYECMSSEMYLCIVCVCYV